MNFADRLVYSAHMKSVHKNDKPYNCPQCDRTFARRSDLRKHTIVHTGKFLSSKSGSQKRISYLRQLL